MDNRPGPAAPAGANYIRDNYKSRNVDDDEEGEVKRNGMMNQKVKGNDDDDDDDDDEPKSKGK